MRDTTQNCTHVDSQNNRVLSNRVLKYIHENIIIYGNIIQLVAFLEVVSLKGGLIRQGYSYVFIRISQNGNIIKERT